MSNRFFYDPDFIEFKNEEKLTFFFILGEASQQNKYGEVLINETLYSRITGLNKQTLLNTIDKLLILGAAAGCRRDGGKIATATVHNITLHNNNTSSKADAIAPEFDLEILYQSYPRKIGKQVGLKNLAKIIKSDKDYQEFKLAIKNYSSLVSNEDKKYIKHFSSFVGTKTGNQPWRDFIELENKQNKPKRIYVDGKFMDYSEYIKLKSGEKNE